MEIFFKITKFPDFQKFSKYLSINISRNFKFSKNTNTHFQEYFSKILKSYNKKKKKKIFFFTRNTQNSTEASYRSGRNEGAGGKAIVTGARRRKQEGRISDKGPALLRARAVCMTIPSEILPPRRFPPIPRHDSRALSSVFVPFAGPRVESRGCGPSTVAGPPPLSQCRANKVNN